MCAFTTQRVADGLAAISLGHFISVITYVHSTHGLTDPNENRAVRQVRDGLRRTSICRRCSAVGCDPSEPIVRGRGLGAL
ncbi:integrase family protein [Nocardioides sp. CF8]|nr:integrase family protein [Nocardioides sp. CF8]